MGQGSTGIERARQDLAEGRPWKARQRIGSYLGAHPADQEALDLLGEVCAAMNDLPAAGAAWFLTTRDDEQARAAIATMQREYARSLNGLLGALNVRRPIDDPAWPEPVRARLRALSSQAREQYGLGWFPAERAKPQWRWTADSGAAGEQGEGGGRLQRALTSAQIAKQLLLAAPVPIAIGLATAGCTLLGLVVAVRWLLHLL